jgi:hypothetical protein
METLSSTIATTGCICDIGAPGWRGISKSGSLAMARAYSMENPQRSYEVVEKKYSYGVYLGLRKV